MVKSISKIFLSVLSLAVVCLVIGCDLNVDLLGLFGSNDLNERLTEKNNFRYLIDSERNFNYTTPVPDPSDPILFSFIVLTDTHVENGDTTDLRKIKDEIINNNARFLVNIGDMSQSGAEQDIQAIIDLFRNEITVPCYPVIGNHDVYFGNWPVWKENIGSTRYRINGEIDGEFFTLFILDSANAFIGKSQVDWLEDELETANGKVFVFTHSDFFVQDKIKIQQLYDQAERARIMSLLRGKCDIMFSGHSHERVIKEFGGVTYISIEDYKSTLTYCLVKVTKTGVIYEFKNL